MLFLIGVVIVNLDTNELNELIDFVTLNWLNHA